MKHPTVRDLQIAFVAVVAACASEDQAPRQTAAVAPDVVRLTATEYAFQSPDTIPAGWTTFRLANQGQEVYYGHIVRLEPRRTMLGGVIGVVWLRPKRHHP